MDSFHLLPTQRERRGEQYMPTKQAQPESPNHAFHLLQGFAIVLRKPAPGKLAITRTFQDCLVRKEREFALHMQRLREQLSQVRVCDETILQRVSLVQKASVSQQILRIARHIENRSLQTSCR